MSTKYNKVQVIAADSYWQNYHCQNVIFSRTDWGRRVHWWKGLGIQTPGLFDWLFCRMVDEAFLSQFWLQLFQHRQGEIIIKVLVPLSLQRSGYFTNWDHLLWNLVLRNLKKLGWRALSTVLAGARNFKLHPQDLERSGFPCFSSCKTGGMLLWGLVMLLTRKCFQTLR